MSLVRMKQPPMEGVRILHQASRLILTIIAMHISLKIPNVEFNYDVRCTDRSKSNVKVKMMSPFIVSK